LGKRGGGRKLSARALSRYPIPMVASCLSSGSTPAGVPWVRSLGIGGLAGLGFALLEGLLAWAWPAFGGSPSWLDLGLALLWTGALGALGGALARLLWRRHGVLAWLPLAALIAPQLLRPFALDYRWDPVVSGAMILLAFLLPRAGAALGALVLALAPFAIAAGLERPGPLPEASPAPPAGGPDILLITVDTLRADAGLQLPEPERWLVYQQAVSAAPWTLPAMLSVFSGEPVRVHLGGLPAQRGGGYTQPDAPRWLTEELSRRGYRCAAFVSNPYLGADFGFERSFAPFVHADDFREPFLARRAFERLRFQWTGRVERLRRERDERVVAAALAWLEEAPAGPWFLWVHLLAPHEYSRDLAAPVRGWAPGTEEPELLRQGYRVNVAATGLLVARLVRAVEPAQALVVFTADHGEQLGEQGVFGHGLALGDEELRVPLALRGPGVEPGLETRQVSLADLGPLLATVEARVPPLPIRAEAPVGGLRRRNKAGSFALRSAPAADGGEPGGYREDLPAVHRARARRAPALISPDEDTRRALEALGYLD
jgi:hypothetical protein